MERDSAKRKLEQGCSSRGIAEAVKEGEDRKKTGIWKEGGKPVVPTGASPDAGRETGNLVLDWEAAAERNHMGEVKPVEMSGNPNSDFRKSELDFATHSEMAPDT